jgi:hypothetical protein
LNKTNLDDHSRIHRVPVSCAVKEKPKKKTETLRNPNHILLSKYVFRGEEELFRICKGIKIGMSFLNFLNLI